MRSNVLVIGTGPVGLCLLLALAARGLEVVVSGSRGVTPRATSGFDEREAALHRLRMGLDVLRSRLRGNEGRA